MKKERKGRVLVAKPGLDGHDRGARVVAYALRQAGIEVIYTGLHQAVDAIVNIAIQEDVDLIGLSILSGSHLGLTKKLMDKMAKAGIGEKKVVIGGVIPHGDISVLKEMGVEEVYPGGSDINEVVSSIMGILRRNNAFSGDAGT
jgi:methylmalonyl-CoA mutase C-terminal domain/subunit